MELPCKSYCISGFAVLCCFSCPESPASGVLRAGVSGLPGFGAKSPADGACGIGVRSWSGVSPKSPPLPESPALVVRSLRYEFFCIGFFLTFCVRSLCPFGPESPPGPESPASQTGNSGLSGLQRLFFWEGYKYPSTYLQPLSSSKHVFPPLSPPLLTLESLPLSQFLQ